MAQRAILSPTLTIWYAAGSQSSTKDKADAKLGAHNRLEASLPGMLDIDNYY